MVGGAASDAPEPSKGSQTRRAIAVLALAVLLLGGGVFACDGLLFGRAWAERDRLASALGASASNVDVSLDMIDWWFTIHVAPGHEAEAGTIACEIVAPSVWAFDSSARWELMAADGTTLKAGTGDFCG